MRGPLRAYRLFYCPLDRVLLTWSALVRQSARLAACLPLNRICWKGGDRARKCRIAHCHLARHNLSTGGGHDVFHQPIAMYRAPE